MKLPPASSTYNEASKQLNQPPPQIRPNIVFFLISVILRHTDADNGVEGHGGAFVVSSSCVDVHVHIAPVSSSCVATNKDKEAAFEITHKLQNFESQKRSKSLQEISWIFETFARNLWNEKLALNRTDKVQKVTQGET